MTERDPDTRRRDTLQEADPSVIGVIRGSRWRPSRRLVGIGALIAAGLAVLWLVVVPEQTADAAGWRYAALRWGHAVCWALLALAAAVHALRGPRALVSAAAWSALGAYLAFLAAMAL